MRYARITKSPMADRATVENYLPSNYSVSGEGPDAIYIEGQDNAGWTLDGYVIPRLGSGLIPCEEITEEVHAAREIVQEIIDEERAS